MEARLSPIPYQLPNNNKKTSNLDILLPQVDNLSLDSDDESDETEDIFAEFHRDSFLRPYAVPGKKYIPKTEADRRTVDKFTDEFKKTVRAIREETGLSDSLLDEEKAIEEILERKPTYRASNKNFDENRGTPIEIEGQGEQESTPSSESNFWRLLLANSSSKFHVSPPVFDAYRQEEKHWLERPAVPWETVEASRIKCKKWLDRNL